MIDFSKITSQELTILKQIVSKASEKSELEKFYIFTSNTKEKAKIYCFCYRFLVNLYNLLDNGDLRDAVKQEIELNEPKFNTIKRHQDSLASEIYYGSSKTKELLNIEVNCALVDGLIDLFSVLTERAHTLQISKLKAILLEGKSGEEYKKLLKTIEEKKS